MTREIKNYELRIRKALGFFLIVNFYFLICAAGPAVTQTNGVQTNAASAVTVMSGPVVFASVTSTNTTVTFSTPMPDTNYQIIIVPTNTFTTAYLRWTNLTSNGFSAVLSTPYKGTFAYQIVRTNE